MKKDDKIRALINTLREASRTVTLKPDIINRHIKNAGLSAMFKEVKDPNAVEIGNVYKVLGHNLKVTSIKQHQHGKIVNLNCYATGCCTSPFIMHMACSEKDVKSFELKK